MPDPPKGQARFGRNSWSITKSLGHFPEAADFFWILAGDIITTEAAYSLGERIATAESRRPKFIVGTATCDLVPNRKRKNALLFEIHPIFMPNTDAETKELKGKIGQLASFKDRQYMYLPPLPGDPENVVANVVSFDDFALARLDDLVVSERLASLSLPGWRIFSALLRVNLTREGEHEADLRSNSLSRYSSGTPDIQSGIQA